MNDFLNALENENNLTLTENFAVANKSTKSGLLDFFALGGAVRTRSDNDIVRMFTRAWNENKELAMKCLFYFRDVRGGQGQRHAFRAQLKYLANIEPKWVQANLQNIAEFGRFDDLYALMDTKLEKEVFNLFKTQLMSDLRAIEKDGESATISLLAKWLKSENASSKETKKLGKHTRKALALTSKQYRKALSTLRKHLNVVERDISKNEWNKIDYSHVPAQAGMLYRKAFARHDEERYVEYIKRVNTGEEKINAGTLYPYEIISKIGIGWGLSNMDPAVAQAYWDNLPDYIAGNEESSIAVVDVSGSMYGTPMEVAVSLGLYMAERAKGPFKDTFITFSETPELQKIKGNNIVSKVRGMNNNFWDNTNIEAVFDLILRTAVNSNLSQEDIPAKIYIISDMQFDSCVKSGNNKTVFNTMKQRFADAGYKLPNIVFWNVDARHDQVPATMTDTGVQLVSGFSPSIFQWLMTGEFKSPYDLMLDVLNSERYSRVVTP